jgi:hypothetical protein
MKKYLFLALALATSSTAANAEHWDIIGFKLNDGCSINKYLEIKEDFNEWGAAYGYQASIIVPLQSDDLESFWWIGKSESAAAFGAAWGAWRNDLANPESTPARLNARLAECSTNFSREGYEVF